MSPLPEKTRNRWEHRTEPETGQGTVYWHVLFQEQGQVRKLAHYAQSQLSSFSGFHMTPLKWLHMTTLVVGSTHDVTPEDMRRLVVEATHRLSSADPIQARLSRVLYHPEAIMLGVEPRFPLSEIHETMRSATRAAIGIEGITEEYWTPHITLCYSTSEQPIAPIIATLGRELPSCDITINAISLVVQYGAERLWDWHPVGTVHFGTSLAGVLPQAR